MFQWLYKILRWHQAMIEETDCSKTMRIRCPDIYNCCGITVSIRFGAGSVPCPYCGDMVFMPKKHGRWERVWVRQMP